MDSIISDLFKQVTCASLADRLIANGEKAIVYCPAPWGGQVIVSTIDCINQLKESDGSISVRVLASDVGSFVVDVRP